MSTQSSYSSNLNPIVYPQQLYWPVTICSIGILISFFLPWITFSLHLNLLVTTYDRSFAGNGWQIAHRLIEFSNQDITDNSISDLAKYSYLIYLPVAFAIINVLLDIIGLRRITLFIFSEFLWGFVALGYLVFLIIFIVLYILSVLQQYGISPDNAASALSYIQPALSWGTGFWGVAIFSFLGCILSFWVPSQKRQARKARRKLLFSQAPFTSQTLMNKKYQERRQEENINNPGLQPNNQPLPITGSTTHPHQDQIDQLKQLKELLDNGVLTQQEFDFQKSKILSS